MTSTKMTVQDSRENRQKKVGFQCRLPFFKKHKSPLQKRRYFSEKLITELKYEKNA